METEQYERRVKPEQKGRWRNRRDLHYEGRVGTIINENSIAGHADLPSGPSTLIRTLCFRRAKEAEA